MKTSVEKIKNTAIYNVHSIQYTINTVYNIQYTRTAKHAGFCALPHMQASVCFHTCRLLYALILCLPNPLGCRPSFVNCWSVAPQAGSWILYVCWLHVHPEGHCTLSSSVHIVGVACTAFADCCALSTSTSYVFHPLKIALNTHLNLTYRTEY